MKSTLKVRQHDMQYTSFPYETIRRISCPEDTANGRNVYSGHAPADAFLELPNNENVREYLLEAEGRKRKAPTQVHRAMRETLENNPENFSILNGGIVIVTKKAEVDDKNKIIKMYDASIINGAQTQGELRRYFEHKKKAGQEPYPLHVTFEIIVTEDEDLIGEISIARNFQNDVLTISIAGRRGQLDELEEHFQKKHPDKKLRKSETKLSDDYVMTEKLLQVITALVPAELWMKQNEKENPNKVFTYNMKTKCLKEFQDIFVKKDNPNESRQSDYRELYQFYLDTAVQAWDLYNKWKTHPGFKGTRLRSIERENGEIVEVPDGIIFPILSSLSAFAKKTEEGWKIVFPNSLDENELIGSAIDVYKNIANHDSSKMGRSLACYSSLYNITKIYRRLSAD